MNNRLTGSDSLATKQPNWNQCDQSPAVMSGFFVCGGGDIRQDPGQFGAARLQRPLGQGPGDLPAVASAVRDAPGARSVCAGLRG